MFKNIYYQFLLLVSFILVSCSTYMPSPAKSPISTTKRHNHWESISQLSHYQTYGAFTYISSKQKIYTRFKWQQLSNKHYRLLLISPIGLTALDLTVQPDIAQFINKQGKRYVCNNPESMITQLTGLDIPLNNLQQWIIGLPGEATDFTLDNHGYLKTLNYQRNGKSWTVNYQDYHNDTVPVLPATFELRQGDNLIKLKIYSWNI